MKRFTAILFLLISLIAFASADTGYILCQPDSFVYARMFPVRGSEVAGMLELGDEIETDWVKRNGFVKVYGFEAGEAWVHSGFITEYPVKVETVEMTIISKGRVACRRSIKGTRRKWLTNGTKLTVYGRSADWSVTNKGFIQTDFLGFSGASD